MAAPEIACRTAPCLMGAGLQRKVIRYIMGHFGKCRFHQLWTRRLFPKALRKDTVPKILFPIICVFCFPGPSKQIICQTHHIIHSTMFLVHSSQPGCMVAWRCPNFSACLTPCYKWNTFLNRLLPIPLYNFPILLLACNLIGSGSAMNFRNRRVCMHIAQRILS